MFGRAIRRATRRSVSLAEADSGFSVLPRPNVSERLELSLFFALISGAGAAVATVIRSASARAAATCASTILVLKLERPTVGCGSAMFARSVLDSVATALPAGCRAPADLVSIAAELILTKLIGGPAVRSRRADSFVPVHDPGAACGGG